MKLGRNLYAHNKVSSLLSLQGREELASGWCHVHCPHFTSIIWWGLSPTAEYRLSTMGTGSTIATRSVRNAASTADTTVATTTTSVEVGSTRGGADSAVAEPVGQRGGSQPILHHMPPFGRRQKERKHTNEKKSSISSRARPAGRVPGFLWAIRTRPAHHRDDCDCWADSARHWPERTDHLAGLSGPEPNHGCDLLRQC